MTGTYQKVIKIWRNCHETRCVATVCFSVFVCRSRLRCCWCWGAETGGCLLTRVWSSTKCWRAELLLSGTTEPTEVLNQSPCMSSKLIIVTNQSFTALPVVLFIPSRLLWFPEDGHSLSRVDTLADCFLNTVLWLQQHLRTHTPQKEFCCWISSPARWQAWTHHCLFNNRKTFCMLQCFTFCKLVSNSKACNKDTFTNLTWPVDYVVFDRSAQWSRLSPLLFIFPHKTQNSSLVCQDHWLIICLLRSCHMQFHFIPL